MLTWQKQQRRVEEARAQAEAAHERAAKLTKETEALRNENLKLAGKAAFARSRAVPLIHTFEGHSMPVRVITASDTEAAILARDFVKAFKDAGCDVDVESFEPKVPYSYRFGNFDPEGEAGYFAQALVKIFGKGGLWPSNPFPLDNTPVPSIVIYLKPLDR